MKPVVRRVSRPGDHGAYEVYLDGHRVGSVVTDETRVWHGYHEGGLIAAVPTKREALAAVVEAIAKVQPADPCPECRAW